ncbi:hypothetical protein [Kordia jejudonensis]|uniref:hypothetical protein n=1 Tax=Kordia jejudonensis TaxID=1348245 RepID=UPI0006297C91|nr:hypothetical protein [Kordia jejudonensis]
MKADKDNIIQILKEKGLVIDAVTEKELLTVYSIFLQNLVDDEVTILEEILRIEEKIETNEKLTYLEDVFHKYVINTYKKD